jgi:hypothetical protein
LLTAHVAGRAVLAAVTDDGALLVPLARSGRTSAGAAAFAVEITYLQDLVRFAEGALVGLALPHSGLAASTLRWEVRLPAGWAAARASGNVHPEASYRPVEFAGDPRDGSGPEAGRTGATALFEESTLPVGLELPSGPEVFHFSLDLVDPDGPPPTLSFALRTRTTGMIHKALAFLLERVAFYLLLRRSAGSRAQIIATGVGLVGTAILTGISSWASATLGLGVHLALGLFMGAVVFGLSRLAIAPEAIDG